jgi:acetoacetate decarboxylase
MMSGGSELLGYSLPLSPKGRAALVGSPPWHYSGRIFYVSYKTDPAEVKKWLPAPFELGPDPELAGVMFCEWHSFPTADPEFGARYPERSQYQEVLVMIGCSLNGRAGQRCVAAWVDNDFTLVRGWFQGYPKKLGRISIARPTEFSPPEFSACRLGAGGLISAICESGGERLVSGALKIKEQGSLDDIPPLMRRPIYLTRHFPGAGAGDAPAVNEIITLSSEKPGFGPIWKGDAELVFRDSPFEEHASLAPREILGGYHIAISHTVKGAKVLHRYSTGADETRS